jgi:RimJ/RimL family protein N-acetyltransferase
VYDARPVGYIQVFRVQAIPHYRAAYDLEEEAAGIDLYIGDTGYLHRGLGLAVLRRFLAEIVFRGPAVVGCVIGPEPENLAAMRAYEKAGFRHLKTVTLPDSGERHYLMRLGGPNEAPDAAAEYEEGRDLVIEVPASCIASSEASTRCAYQRLSRRPRSCAW